MRILFYYVSWQTRWRRSWARKKDKNKITGAMQCENPQKAIPRRASFRFQIEIKIDTKQNSYSRVSSEFNELSYGKLMFSLCVSQSLRKSHSKDHRSSNYNTFVCNNLTIIASFWPWNPHERFQLFPICLDASHFWDCLARLRNLFWVWWP